MNNLIIFGDGEIAKMAHYYFTNDSIYTVVAFIVDDDCYSAGKKVDDLPIFPLSEAPKLFPSDKFSAHVALGFRGLNKIREQKYYTLKKLGYKLASYVCSKSSFWGDLNTGDNCLILENQTIQPTVKIGNNVMIWSGNHLGHGTIIRDHAYISSHVCIAGFCDIGKRCFFGINSSIKDQTKISDDCFIGMGTIVSKNLAPGSLVIADRSKVIGADDRAKNRLLNMFFN